MTPEIIKFDLPEKIFNDFSVVTRDVILGLNQKLDDIIKEGLKLKGFDFSDPSDLKEFIKINCRCEDNVFDEEKIYFVNDIPFLLYSYGNGFDFSLDFESGGFKVNMGYYAFI